ncbi:MAG: flagellar biosynthetic protein FliR [Bryobacteraceae bacterium]|nr:flagellar biosynthetic protein FliR [Bryobacteraceae bacterium]
MLDETSLRLTGELRPVWPLVSAFLVCLARIGGMFVFFPWPGARTAPPLPRVFLTVALSVSLAPRVAGSGTPPAFLPGILLAEAALGFSAGLVLLFLMEALSFGGHLIGTQAGFSYASSIDPSTEADSTVIPVLLQWLGNVLFFAAGFDRWLMRAMVQSLEAIPPGAWQLTPGAFELVTRLLSSALETGVRLALPVAGFLLLVDLTLAVVGRLNAQFPLLNIAFPLKTGLAALALGATAGLVPAAYAKLMELAGEALGGVLRWP